MKNCKSIVGVLVVFTIILVNVIAVKAAENDFLDVPKDHWAYDHIHKMRDMGIINGVGDNQFGLGSTITRGEFVTILVNYFKWDIKTSSENQWYSNYVETAFQKGAIENSGNAFRPKENITREEMAVILVEALGYDSLANQISYIESPFSDVHSNVGYINIAKDFGIISGVGGGNFAPNNTATREQVAAMFMRIDHKVTSKINFINGFYAIKSSSQQSFINSLDATSFGWARIELEEGRAVLNTSSKNNNEYSTPSGFEGPLGIAKSSSKALLMVTVAEDGNNTTKNIVADSNLRAQTVVEIANGLSNFDGVVIDFEGLKGEEAKQGLNSFLKELDGVLGDKQLFVAVHPKMPKGHDYYDGYDYATIGSIADKVILMSHDYNAKRLTADEMAQGIVMTPLAPIDNIYYSLKAITDENTGVKDINKIVLQISFDTAQWKTVDGKVIHQSPYRPDYETLKTRMDKGVEYIYHNKSESPYITFVNTDDNSSNVIWYENGQSVAAKIKIAKMFGINGISVWRLGNIPADSWEVIVNR